MALGPGGIRLAEGKNLQLETNVQLAGRQAWNIPGGSTVELKPSPVQDKASTPSACPDRRKCRWFVRKAEGERREWPASC